MATRRVGSRPRRVSSWTIESKAGLTSSDGITTIQTGHSVTNTASVTVDQVTVQSGGQLTVSSGVTLTINNGVDTDLDVLGTLSVIGTLTVNSSAKSLLPIPRHVAWRINSKVSRRHNAPGVREIGCRQSDLLQVVGTL